MARLTIGVQGDRMDTRRARAGEWNSMKVYYVEEQDEFTTVTLTLFLH